MTHLKLVVLIAVIALVSNVAFAGLIVDIRAVSTTGGCAIGDTNKLVEVAGLGTVTFDVYAKVTGSATTAPTFKSLQGAIRETVPTGYIAKGDMSYDSAAADKGTNAYVYAAPYDTSLIPTLTINSAGDKEMNGTNLFAAVAAAQQPQANDTYFRIGRFTYTLNADPMVGPGFTTIDFYPKTTAPGASYYVNGVSMSGTSAGFASAGAVVIGWVPEPTAIVMLGTACLALLVFRHRK
jgi:hypothetical protein